MARSRRLGVEERQDLALQLRGLMRHWRGEGTWSRIELKEGFELKILRPRALTGDSVAEVRRSLQSRGLWLHQIHSGDHAIGLAHALRRKGQTSRSQLAGFFLTPIAAKIAEAIKAIDAERPDNGIRVELCLLQPQSYFFFLLFGSERVEIRGIHAGRQRLPLEERRFHSVQEFRAALGLVNEVPGLVLGPWVRRAGRSRQPSGL